MSSKIGLHIPAERSAQRLFRRFGPPRSSSTCLLAIYQTVSLGNWASGIHLCYSAWHVGLPKEAGSKEHKMSIFPTRILLATDGSEEATLAAQTAIDLANKTGSELHVVHVRISLYSPAFSKAYEGYEEGVDVGAYLQDESEELTRRGQGLLDEQVRKIKAAGGNVAQAHLRVGRPEAEITALAEEIGAG